MEYNELLTLVINCFDGRSYEDHFDILYKFMLIENGKQQFQKMYQDQQMLAAYVAALLRTTGNSNCIDFDAFNFEEVLLELCLKPRYKDVLVNFLNGTMLLKEYRSSDDNDTIVREWFDEKEIADKSNRKKKQQNEIKTKLLYILISLLGTNKDDLTALAQNWDGKKYQFALNNKMKLKKYLLQLVSAATTATPRKQKHGRTPRKNDGSTLFSPSMKSPIGKKQRSIAVSPPKSNKNRPRTLLQKFFSPGKNDTRNDDDDDSDNNNNDTNHVIVETVLEENDEHIETMYNHNKHLTVDTSFGDGGCDDDDDDDDDDNDDHGEEFRIRSTVQGGPNRVTPVDVDDENESNNYSHWSSPTKKTTRTDAAATVSTPKSVTASASASASASAYEAALAASIRLVDDYDVEDDNNALNEANALTFIPSPKCRSPKKKLIKFKDQQKYPTLFNGCDTYADVPTALEEAFKYLGYESLWDTISGKETAPVLTLKSKNGRHRKYVYVPVSSTQECFLSNANNKKWINHLIKTAGSDELSEDDVAAIMMVYLIKHHPDALQVVAEKLKIPQLMVNRRMDPHTAAAMWNEANTTVRGQRTINRYVFQYFGFRLTPYDAELQKLTDHHIKPIHESTKVGKEIITWWYKEIDEVVLNLLNNDFDQVDFDAIDIVFGGDHGAGVGSCCFLCRR